MLPQFMVYSICSDLSWFGFDFCLFGVVWLFGLLVSFFFGGDIYLIILAQIVNSN